MNERSTIWECDGYRKTGQQAVDQFAAAYWAKPRKAFDIDADGFFHVQGGWRTYRVRLIDNISPSVYRITVERSIE